VTAAIIMLGFVIMVATVTVGVYCILKMQDTNYTDLKQARIERDACLRANNELRVEIQRLKNRKVHDADNPE
jgi:hypothetical protein